uniref:Chromate transporter, chromate ion transporter family n=1 Tax=Desulfovibrio sp. U5L TaxID=596152 RepID=I2PYA2_9BACT
MGKDTPSLGAIFGVFFRLGVTGFGGPAMIAVIRDLSVNHHRWVSEEGFRDGLVLAQSIPGATAMQVAAYVGLSRRGVPGALAAYLGLGLPAFFLMLGLSAFYARTQSIAWMVSLMHGLSVAVVALIGFAAWTFARVSCREVRGAAVAGISAVALGLGVNPFLVIVGAAAAGMALYHDREPSAAPVPPGNALRRGLAQSLPLFAALCLVMAATWLYSPGLFDLARLMLGINCVSFSGGFAALPLMYHQIVDVAGQMPGRMFMDGIALGQITPGPISITSTFLGYMLFGPVGAVVATIAMFAPSFLILLTVAPSFAALKGSRGFFRASLGIAASFVGLLAYVTWKFALEATWGPAAVALLAVSLLALWRRIDILYVVGFAALYSLLLL